MIRRALLAVALLLGSVLGTGVVAPAQAGESYWTPTLCYSQWPVKGMWFGEKTMGVWFRSAYGQFGVAGRIYPEHVRLWAECGIGFPISEETRVEGASVQYFLLPGTCALNFIIAWDNAPTGSYSIPHYFC